MSLAFMDGVKLEALSVMSWIEPLTQREIAEKIIESSRKRHFGVLGAIQVLNQSKDRPIPTFLLCKAAEMAVKWQVRESINGALYQLGAEGDVKKVSKDQYIRSTDGPPPSQPNTSGLQAT